ncbi:MAG TPA: response regulator transcription factor [Candidatus Dormibacteraeota bacterium]|nr:response regulator transcription factor [Candidatus Dormibacteraeota bacterium]
MPEAAPSAGAGRKVLLVEDDEAVRMTLRYNLAAVGYVVLEAASGTRGLELARSRTPDLLVLDLMLPELTGEEVCRIIRQESNVPILMLTARGEEVDKVKGLAQGADDYMTKPFGVQEFLARVEALIRRAEQPRRASARPETVRLGNFLLDASARRVVIDDKEVKMSPREFNLLYHLLEHAGRVHSRDALLRDVWGSDFHGDSKTVAVHIRWLREKFETFPTLPFRISTVFGVGYRVDLAPGVRAER